jgi:hypothetical protein
MGGSWSEYAIAATVTQALLFELYGYCLARLATGLAQQFGDVGILILQGDIECCFS